MTNSKSILLFAFFCFLCVSSFSQISSNTLCAQSAVEELPRAEDGQEDPQADEKSNDEQENESDPENEEPKDKDETDDKAQESIDVETDDSKSGKASGRSTSSKRYSKRAPDLLDVFRPIVASASESTVLVKGGRRQIAMGTVVDSDGLILTKASELRGDLKCVLPNGESYPATVFGVDPDTDLALLKIEASDLPLPQWSEQGPPMTGQWLATPNNESEPIAIGVVSVDERRIPPSKPFIGIQMLPTDDNSGVRINRVISGTPADRSGLLVNDVIFKLDETDIPDQQTLVDSLGQYSIGDIAKLTVRRGDKEVKIGLTLADEENVSPQFDRSKQQNQLGSTPSKRRKNFPLAFQHDSVLQNKNCGGPIVDLNGRIVGINIARGGRVSSLALSRAVVLPVIEKLKTGAYAPAVVFAEKIKKLDVELAEVITKLETLPAKKVQLEQKLGITDARKEELERMLKDIEGRLKSIEEHNVVDRKQLEDLARQLKIAKSTKRNLESLRKKLNTGAR